jgi:hypothetical protein
LPASTLQQPRGCCAISVKVEKPSQNGGNINMSKDRKIAKAVVRRLKKHGYFAVFAGGCVRDRFLGL